MRKTNKLNFYLDNMPDLGAYKANLGENTGVLEVLGLSKPAQKMKEYVSSSLREMFYQMERA